MKGLLAHPHWDVFYQAGRPGVVARAKRYLGRVSALPSFIYAGVRQKVAW